MSGYPFDGATLIDDDVPRLKSAMDRVFDLMKDCEWRTLKEISDACATSYTGASARLRDFRKKKFKHYGVTEVLSMRTDEPGVWEYRFESVSE